MTLREKYMAFIIVGMLVGMIVAITVSANMMTQKAFMVTLARQYNAFINNRASELKLNEYPWVADSVAFAKHLTPFYMFMEYLDSAQAVDIYASTDENFATIRYTTSSQKLFDDYLVKRLEDYEKETERMRKFPAWAYVDRFENFTAYMKRIKAERESKQAGYLYRY